ncbi:MAG: hypothetical protein Q7U92_17310, partial [Bradyrhizobium sp.]|nr:hypothetical protein [Bradyrhizobium sp.]
MGQGAADADQKGKPGNGEMAQNRTLKLKHTSTHRFPDLLPVPRPARTRCFDAVQMGPQCGGDASGFPNDYQVNFQGIPMTDISDFVQQSHNFIPPW